jgi:hypothetical protein
MRPTAKDNYFETHLSFLMYFASQETDTLALTYQKYKVWPTAITQSDLDTNQVSLARLAFLITAPFQVLGY